MICQRRETGFHFNPISYPLTTDAYYIRFFFIILLGK